MLGQAATTVIILCTAIVLLTCPLSSAKHSGLAGYKAGTTAHINGLLRVRLDLVPPPSVPNHFQHPPRKPRIVEVDITIIEKEIEIEPGVFFRALTYNGTIPGPMRVAHEGDYIEVTLRNPKSNELVHNIDFHASTGALGGVDLTMIKPGQEVILRWKATKPGCHVYHCAPGGAMTPWHVVRGMSGAVVILPRYGIRDRYGKVLKYDKAFYVGEHDLYLPKDAAGKYKYYNSTLDSFYDDQQVMNGLIPTHVLFGQRRGELNGKNAMRAKVGDTIIIFHMQANRRSSPHLIGGHGDYVWERGNLADIPLTDLESWNIAAGSCGAAMYTFLQPGRYIYLNHNLIEAVNLGATSEFQVDGTWNNDLMELVKPPGPY